MLRHSLHCLRQFACSSLILLPLLCDVLGVLGQGAREYLLNFADLALASLLVARGLVVPLDHVDQLVDIEAGYDDVADLLLGLHLSPRHEGS